MVTRNERNVYWLTAVALAVMLAFAAVNGCKDDEPAPSTPEPAAGGTTPAPTPGTTNDPIEAAKSLFAEPTASLQKAIEEAKTWEPAFAQWRGKIAPDFTLTDIVGNVHKLSNYRGRNVAVIFWATWCGPCRLEVPELIELRKATPEDKLTILAISREDAALLKNFVAQNQVNYTVLSSSGASLPSPYADVQSIPSAFFIDPEGKIRLATVGMLPQADIKKVLEAK